MHTPIFWLTGLSGSGKSTIAKLVSDNLAKKELKVRIIDGDDVRDNRSRRLGFSAEDIEINNKLICELCQIERKNYDVIMVPVISPLESVRKLVREMLEPNFFLIYCNANLESVVKRDVKGLYQKAKLGLIPDMIGFSDSSPYQEPLNSDLILNTNGHLESELDSFMQALDFINSKL